MIPHLSGALARALPVPAKPPGPAAAAWFAGALAAVPTPVANASPAPVANASPAPVTNASPAPVTNASPAPVTSAAPASASVGVTAPPVSASPVAEPVSPEPIVVAPPWPPPAAPSLPHRPGCPRPERAPGHVVEPPAHESADPSPAAEAPALVPGLGAVIAAWIVPHAAPRAPHAAPARPTPEPRSDSGADANRAGTSPARGEAAAAAVPAESAARALVGRAMPPVDAPAGRLASEALAKTPLSARDVLDPPPPREGSQHSEPAHVAEARLAVAPLAARAGSARERDARAARDTEWLARHAAAVTAAPAPDPSAVAGPIGAVRVAPAVAGAPVLERVLAAAAATAWRPAASAVVRFADEQGGEGHVRVALREGALHATIVAPDAASGERLRAGLDALRETLEARMGSEARLTVRVAGEGTAAPATDRGDARRQEDGRAGDDSRRPPHGRERHPRQHPGREGR